MQGDFDGATYDPELDQDRLQHQLSTVRRLLLNHEWWTLRELAETTGHPEASISARIRDLRKPKFGAFNVAHRRVGKSKGGTWEYRIVPEPAPIPKHSGPKPYRGED